MVDVIFPPTLLKWCPIFGEKEWFRFKRTFGSL